MIAEDMNAENPDAADLTIDEAVSVLQKLANAAYPAGFHQGSTLEEHEEEGPLSSAVAKQGVQQDSTKGWTEETYRGLLESLPDALVIVERSGAIVLVNSQTERLFGYQRSELLNKHIELLVPIRFRTKHVSHRNEYFANPHVRPMGAGIDLHGRHKNGTPFPVEISLSPLQSETGLHAISTIRDISDKKRLEVRYRTLVEEIPAVTFSAALDGGVSELYVSPQIEELLGFTQQEWVENPILWYTQLHEDDRERWHNEFARTLNCAERFQSVYRFRARDGRVVWVHGEAKVVRDSDGRPLFLQGVAFDITDRKEAEEALRHARDELEEKVQDRTAELAKSLQDKDVLLKEVHHRVKNNLQLLSTIFRSLARSSQDPKVAVVFDEMQDRLKSIATIFEDLYQGDSFSHIDFGPYVRRLASSLVRTFRPDVRVTTDVHGVFLDIDRAIACGLIINELVSNCLKYAFPERPGEIQITMREENNNYVLSVSDNGVGFPEDLDFRNIDSLGLEIILSQVDRLDGTVELTRQPGTTFTIMFPVEQGM